MTTAKQLHANRKNAQHSSGPKTSEGKVQSSINARSHGLNQAFDLLVSPEITVLQTLFVIDGLSEEAAFELAQAHCGKARVRLARSQVWESVYTSSEMSPDERGRFSDASEEFLAEMDEEVGGKEWRAILPHFFLKPFANEKERFDEVTLTFLDKQRRLNRYDVKAVSTLSKLYKQAYSVK